MQLPASPNAISFLQIRNEFVGASISSSNYGTSNTNLFNLNYYRGKHYYSGGTVLTTFPAGAIAFSDFHSASAVDLTPPPPPPPPPGGGCP